MKLNPHLEAHSSLGFKTKPEEKTGSTDHYEVATSPLLECFTSMFALCYENDSCSTKAFTLQSSLSF